jgi:hypothetical protein
MRGRGLAVWVGPAALFSAGLVATFGGGSSGSAAGTISTLTLPTVSTP